MTLTSMHTHTEFCDGSGDVEGFCRAAFDRGFASVGFSAHAPVGRAGLRTSWHLPEEKLGPYLDAVRDARRRWEGRLAVFLGMEVDYIRGRMGPADPCYLDMGLDYRIGAVHYVPDPLGGDPVAIDGSAEEFGRVLGDRFRGDAAALMSAYWQALGEMIRAGGFEILAHMDLVKKNNPGERYFSRASAAYRGAWAACVRPLAGAGIAVEVNTGGLNRGRTDETYPSGEILAALCREDVPVLITADAHATDHLGGHYDTARRTLAGAGYRSVRVFLGRGGDGPRWREEAL